MGRGRFSKAHEKWIKKTLPDYDTMLGQKGAGILGKARRSSIEAINDWVDERWTEFSMKFCEQLEKDGGLEKWHTAFVRKYRNRRDYWWKSHSSRSTPSVALVMSMLSEEEKTGCIKMVLNSLVGEVFGPCPRGANESAVHVMYGYRNIAGKVVSGHMTFVGGKDHDTFSSSLGDVEAEWTKFCETSLPALSPPNGGYPQLEGYDEENMSNVQLRCIFTDYFKRLWEATQTKATPMPPWETMLANPQRYVDTTQLPQGIEICDPKKMRGSDLRTLASYVIARQADGNSTRPPFLFRDLSEPHDGARKHTRCSRRIASKESIGSIDETPPPFPQTRYRRSRRVSSTTSGTDVDSTDAGARKHIQRSRRIASEKRIEGIDERSPSVSQTCSRRSRHVSSTTSGTDVDTALASSRAGDEHPAPEVPGVSRSSSVEIIPPRLRRRKSFAIGSEIEDAASTLALDEDVFSISEVDNEDAFSNFNAGDVSAHTPGGAGNEHVVSIHTPDGADNEHVATIHTPDGPGNKYAASIRNPVGMSSENTVSMKASEGKINFSVETQQSNHGHLQCPGFSSIHDRAASTCLHEEVHRPSAVANCTSSEQVLSEHNCGLELGAPFELPDPKLSKSSVLYNVYRRFAIAQEPTIHSRPALADSTSRVNSATKEVRYPSLPPIATLPQNNDDARSDGSSFNASDVAYALLHRANRKRMRPATHEVGQACQKRRKHSEWKPWQTATAQKRRR